MTEVQPFLDALKTSSITSLSLRGTGMGVKGVIAVADAMSAMASITLLGIGANPIGADGANALLEAVKLSTTLKALDIGKPLPLQENFDSDALDLSQTDMGPAQVVILSWWLTTSFRASLTKVAIANNKISESDVATLQAAAPNGCEVVC